MNTTMVRLATRGLLDGATFRADGTKVRMALHATPQEVMAAVEIVRALL